MRHEVRFSDRPRSEKERERGGAVQQLFRISRSSLSRFIVKLSLVACGCVCDASLKNTLLRVCRLSVCLYYYYIFFLIFWFHFFFGLEPLLFVILSFIIDTVLSFYEKDYVEFFFSSVILHNISSSSITFLPRPAENPRLCSRKSAEKETFSTSLSLSLSLPSPPPSVCP